MFALDEPAVRLEEIRSVPNVGREGAVLSSHAVDLNRELDRNGQLLEIPCEAHDRGTAEALAVEDEPVGPRLPHELEGDVAAPVLERLGEKAPAPELERELPDSLGLVVPGVAPAEEPHDEAGAVGDRPRGADVLDTDGRTARCEKQAQYQNLRSKRARGREGCHT